MKLNFSIALFLLFAYSYSQTKTVNIDSIKWEKENPNWEKWVFSEPEFLNKLEISKKDKSITLYASMTKECRIFGYDKPSKDSRKMILISVWTFDVKNNPSNCPLNSYYETATMDEMELKYIGRKGSFIEASVIKNKKEIAKVYFEKKWTEFVD